MSGSTKAIPPQRRQPKSEVKLHPPGTTPSWDPERVRYWSELSAPASAGGSRRHHEPGSWPASTCPAQAPSKSGGESPWG